MDSQDWQAWHAPYDEPGSPLAKRLAIVQRRIREAVDAAPPGPLRVVSMCAGQGRDLIGALRDHPRRHDLVARLVELDPRNAETARAASREAGLAGIEVVTGDAGLSDAYAGAVPARLVLVCGVFGNVSEADIANVVRRLPEYCMPGASVLWTRHRLPPDLTPTIRGWFEQGGFEEIGFDAPEGTMMSVGANRLRAEPRPLERDVRLFDFIGFEAAQRSRSRPGS
jgi:Putative methyltransferase